MEIQQELLNALDIDYSYRLAKKMEQFRTHPELGYRTSGSRAEFQTGEMLKEEMERIGLCSVTKDPVTADGWEFKKALLSYTALDGEKRSVLLGAYQTTMVTDGPREYPLLYLGKGTEADYEGRDVSGKLVLVEINQRDEWWINYPVYQAHLKGAAALIAVQSGGYGEIDDEALNAQDIAGPENAPAFSISRKDAAPLKAMLTANENTDCPGQLLVTLDADTRVTRGCTTYNITGTIPGLHPERMILLSAHYDSYFSGFQDDNTAVSMMLGIARALIRSGYQPRNTLVFCAMAAEEWGVADSSFDWSTGAYEQVFTAHPEWAGKVIADLNFELPALAHGTRARIRSCYEYTSYLNEFLRQLPPLTKAYPDETSVTAPIETWSDDFSIAIAGIPSMVNDFTGGSFMETHYHSQFDNDDYYDEDVYRLHHELFLLLVHELDQTAVVPLNFAPVMHRAAKALKCEGPKEVSASFASLKKLLSQAELSAEAAYKTVEKTNLQYRTLLQEGHLSEAEQLFENSRQDERHALELFLLAQDELVRIDWYGNVFYPHEIFIKRLSLLDNAIENLKQNDLKSALGSLYQLDNNAYAFMFDEQVYNHFTEYAFHQPRERLKWGYQRLLPHQNLYHLVKALLAKKKTKSSDFQEEIRHLTRIRSTQLEELSMALERLKALAEKAFLV